ncbi:hypothetical protein FHR32_004452 [Streptosporangium album]|uniref:DUF1449 family protein n=1 Tax=Streptosporangium album TaxID=47479 RepID=A0A7W7RYA2_9ACTN|nr:hypothetical protein [Streptosporangium album]MBB4940147.1 hypothetical protein [Streptosporangium album]
MVVVGYWLFAVASGIGFDGDIDESAGFLSGLGLGGAPIAVAVSLMVVIAWFVSLVGGVLFSGTLVLIGVLAAALVCAWAGTRLILLPLRRASSKERLPSRTDFVGRTCVIRTGRVGRDFGQAEVTAADGSSALVQVRQVGDDAFDAGSTALIFAYDAAGEFFWVMPYDAELDPHRPI